jgi:cytoskeletal protein RodZ
MDELGTILQETREARNLTLEDVAQVTRIRVRYLEALEEGRYDVLPTPVHVRGFLRNYAIFLNLDPEPLIARYNSSRKVVRDIPVSKQVRPELGRAAPQPPETLDDELQPEPVFFRPLGSNLQTPAWF